jgi:hypothetical protein
VLQRHCRRGGVSLILRAPAWASNTRVFQLKSGATVMSGQNDKSAAWIGFPKLLHGRKR